MRDESSILSFKDLKPHVSGTLWQLAMRGPDTEFRFSREWSDHALTLARSIETIIYEDWEALLKRSESSKSIISSPKFLRAHYVQPRSASHDTRLVPYIPLTPLTDLPVALSEKLRLALGDEETVENVTADLLSATDAIVMTGIAYKSESPASFYKKMFPDDPDDGLLGYAALKSERWDLLLFAFAPPFCILSNTGAKDGVKIMAVVNQKLAEHGVELHLEHPPREFTDSALLGTTISHTILRGIHAPNERRASKKSLFGPDLRFALDPLADQTFTYQYGRTQLKLDELVEARSAGKMETSAKALRSGDKNRSLGASDFNFRKYVEGVFPKTHTPRRQHGSEPSRDAENADRAGAGDDQSAPARPPSSQIRHHIGYGHSQRSLFLGSTSDYTEFVQKLDILRELLLFEYEVERFDKASRTVHAETQGLNYLARDLHIGEEDDLGKAFEVDVAVDAETLGPNQTELAAALHDWSYHGGFGSDDDLDVQKTDGEVDKWILPLKAYWDGKEVASLQLSLDQGADSQDMTLKIEQRVSNAPREAHEALEEIVNFHNPLLVRFENGYTYLGGLFYRSAFREILFREEEGWHWMPAVDPRGSTRPTRMTLEKPDEPHPLLPDGNELKPWPHMDDDQMIADLRQSDSLFSRIALDPTPFFYRSKKEDQAGNWMMLCHDQATEMADFVFFDPAAERRRVALVHVKAAKKTKNGRLRQIAIKPYEDVVPQAIKNIRYHSPKEVLSRLKKDQQGTRGRAGLFMVTPNSNGQVDINADTAPFVAAFEKFAADRRPPVVEIHCISPHVRAKLWKQEEKHYRHPTKSPSIPAYMLSMVLFEGRAAAAAANAEFLVWGEDDR